MSKREIVTKLIESYLSEATNAKQNETERRWLRWGDADGNEGWDGKGRASALNLEGSTMESHTNENRGKPAKP